MVTAAKSSGRGRGSGRRKKTKHIRSSGHLNLR